MPTVRQRLGLKRRDPLRMIPTPGGERRLTAAEVRAMKLARADIIGARAVEDRNDLEDARHHVSLLRRHGRVRVAIEPEGTYDGQPQYHWETRSGKLVPCE